ncbi:MAG: WYL domain-containing protein [Propionibacteriales bacterium]|nr:WYL domain-containing protein [Propionibacteriales bacterium]
MAVDKSERLLNLTICLLSTKRYVSKDEIRSAVQGYRDQSDSAFERMFERDKEELRELGVPIETGSFEHFFDDEQGYRISPADFELPPIELTADEAATLGVAARAWRQASVASSTQNAMRKLRAAGVEPDDARLPRLEPVVTAREAGFEQWVDAMIDRRRVTFDYADKGTRTVEPWGITSAKGRWYVVGFDPDRQAPRMFRLSRVRTVTKVSRRAGEFTLPADVDIRELARALEPPASTAEATVALRVGRAAGLRRRGTAATAPADVRLPQGFEVVTVGYAGRDSMVGELAVYGPDVVVLDPPELRTALLRHLAGVGRRGTRSEQTR